MSVVGSHMALTLAAGQAGRRGRVMGPAVALGGCAVWAMHFIGMAAYETPVRVAYAIAPTLLSLVIAVGIVAAGFKIALRGSQQLTHLVLGGVVIGLGVVVMHYMGMLGMNLRAVFEWNLGLVALSVVIAVVAATVALWLAFNMRTRTQRMVAAVVMGVAVCAMHYTGMEAASLICTERPDPNTLSIEGPTLPFLVFLVALIMLGASHLFSRLDDWTGAGRTSSLRTAR